MKTLNKITLIILVCMNCINMTKAQNTGTMSAAKRDSLISLAKEVVLKLGPDWYREYKSPVIEERKHDGSWSKAGRIYYHVAFPYDRTQEKLAWYYAAEVDIWEDTFEPFSVGFGNGLGLNLWTVKDWRTDTTLPIMEYQDATKPEYRFVRIIPDSIEGEQAISEYIKREDEKLLSQPLEPSNKDELLRKGWERRSNGEWVKTRPDVPPTRRNR